jgi:hypothetical protein
MFAKKTFLMGLLAFMLVSLGCNPGGNEEIPRVDIRGQVLDIADDSAIALAQVQALDANGAPAGDAVETDAEGNYVLSVPQFVPTVEEEAVKAEGEEESVPAKYTLRVQALGYDEFPTSIRPALPIDAADAVENDDSENLVIENTATTVKLIALETSADDLGTISGRITFEEEGAALVVASNDDASYIGYSDSQGNYNIFNVPPGSYNVSGYAQGVQIDSAQAEVTAGEETTGIDVAVLNTPLNSVEGSVQIVNAPGGSTTSVILVLKSTFDDFVGRGATPPGLRVADVTGGFIIEDIPDGEYVVLAAFENDDLVRDPDTSIGGTEFVHITLPDPELGADIQISEGFKVTEALYVVSPGREAPEEVSSAPDFIWNDDSGEEGYELWVLDSFGNEIWRDNDVPRVTGSETVTHTYAGPALEPGMFYQFRARSFTVDNDENRIPISITEDLRGVFYYLAE